MVLYSKDNLSLQTKIYVDRKGTLKDGLAICQSDGSKSNWVIANFDYGSSGWHLVECADRLTDKEINWKILGELVAIGHSILDPIVLEKD